MEEERWLNERVDWTKLWTTDSVDRIATVESITGRREKINRFSKIVLSVEIEIFILCAWCSNSVRKKTSGCARVYSGGRLTKHAGSRYGVNGGDGFRNFAYTTRMYVCVCAYVMAFRRSLWRTRREIFVCVKGFWEI